jgi:hypothetical protein
MDTGDNRICQSMILLLLTILLFFIKMTFSSLDPSPDYRQKFVFSHISQFWIVFFSDYTYPVHILADTALFESETSVCKSEEILQDLQG